MAKRIKGRENPDGLIELGKWDKGMVNLLPAKSIPNDALLNAVNVDITDDGRISRRKGYEKLLAPAFNVPDVIYRSLTSFNGFLVFLRGEDLVACKDTGSNETVLKTGFSGDSEMCYEEVDGQLYVMNMKDQFSAIITEKNGVFSLRNFGVPSLKGRPTVTTGSGGTLFKGRYILTYTVENSFGEESGSINYKVVDVESNGSISIICSPSLIPNLLDGNAKVNIYLSKTNGDTCYKAATVDASSGFMFDITSDIAEGKQLVNDLLNPLPIGEILKYYRGRMYSSVGSIVFISAPMNYGLCDFDDEQSGYIDMGNKVKVIAPLQDGIYIVNDRTHWLAGSGPADFVKRMVLPYSAAFGTYCPSQNGSECFWFSDKGWIVAQNSGNVKNINEGKVDPGIYEGGASMHVRKDGYDKLISSLQNGLGSTAICSDFVDAEIRRQE